MASRGQMHFESVNGELEHHAQLRSIAVCRVPWTVGDGFPAPTLKVIWLERQ